MAQPPRHDKTAPPAADPRAGRNPGYAETNPRDRDDAQAKAPPPRSQPDEPGIDRDTDAQPDPAKAAPAKAAPARATPEKPDDARH